MSEKSEKATYNTSSTHKGSQLWLIVLIVVVLCGLSFYGGLAYEKGRNHSTLSSSTSAPGGFGAGGGGRYGGQRPNIGNVTAVSPTSITINNNFNNSSETFTISSSTTVTNNGQSSSVSDIQTGDKVLIRTSGSGSTTATEIDVNPSFGGYGGGGSGSGSANTDSSDSSTASD